VPPHVDAAFDPRLRKNPVRREDSARPLKEHQRGEQPVGIPMDVLLVLTEQTLGTLVQVSG